MVFQLTPGTEAPAEMNFHFPDAPRALHRRERGPLDAQHPHPARRPGPRPARSGPHYLDEAIELFGADTDVLFAGHHWPRWGSERIVEFLAKQRDLYAYLHDQTLRLLNQGLTGAEIAEEIELPPSLAERVALPRLLRLGQPQREGDLPALHGLVRRQPGPPLGAPAGRSERAATSSSMGGAEARARASARDSFEAGDYRWVAEVVNHVVFADPENADGRELQADALEQLGYGAENATWRNFFLMGAQGASRGSLRHPDRDRAARLPRPARASSSSSTRWRSGSTAPAPGACI